MATFKEKLGDLYEPDHKQTLWFNYLLISFDVAMVVYLIVSSFFYANPLIEALDVLFGSIILLDLSARCYIAPSRKEFIKRPLNMVDLVVVLSLLLPVAGESLAFLRVLRIFRLYSSVNLMNRLKMEHNFIHRYEDVIKSSTNLFVFIFVMTALVFESQIGINEGIGNYLDALYFTVATLTTTGFGDVTMKGDFGRFIAVIIMIFGVSLFIRLIQTLYRANKVRFECNHCGLSLHDRDASHCKACGNVIKIPDEGIY